MRDQHLNPMPNPTPSMPPLPDHLIASLNAYSEACYQESTEPHRQRAELEGAIRAYAQAVADARVREAMERAYNALFAVKGDKATLFDAQTAIRNLSRSLAGKGGTT